MKIKNFLNCNIFSDLPNLGRLLSAFVYWLFQDGILIFGVYFVAALERSTSVITVA